MILIRELKISRMKKIMTLVATVALLTGSAFAHEGKKCCAKGKSCCKMKAGKKEKSTTSEIKKP